MTFMITPLRILSEVRRQKRALATMSGLGGIEELTEDFISSVTKEKGAKTLFILGTGASALDIKPSQWAIVNENVSIGIGAWTLHPFVPDFLALEHIDSGGVELVEGGETPYEKSYRLALEGWHDRNEVREKGTRVLMFRPPDAKGFHRLAPLKGLPISAIRLYGRTGSFSNNLKSLSTEVDSFFQLRKFGAVPFALPFDTGSTVVRLVVLGALSGFRQVVLIGVDLRESTYFWEADPSYLKAKGLGALFSQETSAAHSVEVINRTTTSAALLALADLTKRRFNIDLHVGSSVSWLSSCLPVYDWKANDRLP